MSAPQTPPEFSSLAEAWPIFLRRALSDMTPANVKRAVEGGFYAGAQAVLVLLQETADAEASEDDEIVGGRVREKANFLNSECVAFFISAAAAANTRKPRK